MVCRHYYHLVMTVVALALLVTMPVAEGRGIHPADMRYGHMLTSLL